jgi:MFS family permease
MEIPRRRWDIDREPTRRVFGRSLWQPFALLADSRFRRLSIAAFVYAGLSLCLIAFMTVQLTTVVGLNLIEAGQILAAYQIAGSISRPIWGWIADRFITPAQTLAIHGVGMAICLLLTGYYSPAWPVWAIMANALLAGCTAGGYTGVGYAEYAVLGGTRRTEATGLGTAIFFTGGMAVPPIFGAAVVAMGGYRGSYTIGAACALASGLLLALPHRRKPGDRIPE